MTAPVTESVFVHASVLVREVADLLRPAPGGRYLDGTLGGGGHSEEILRRSDPDGRVLGLDRDGEAIRASQIRLRGFGNRLIARQASFSEAGAILVDLGWNTVHGVILDLGVSSPQLETSERGFSFRLDGPLDMRMDRRQPLTAQQLVNGAEAGELERIFREYGEEPRARRIAQAIVAARAKTPIQTTQELVTIIEVAGRGGRRGHHPATQVFQALRIAVNQELLQLEIFLASGYETLLPSARMAVISFHSLEDRIVKQAFRKWSRACLCPPRALRCVCGWSRKASLITKKPIVPSAEEMRRNPRARSAKLRAVERL